ncbi:putative restriction endonuclease [Isoptericola jiangsuensis]|uniref:Putative restriction endonuclease n=1 Tax=Isoptericola jiangsuensis TaxID=548579 RepID=A0A2A9EW92_9MICO|nr:HNH endonuclease [Isoptericola jiangsuensis]PFG42429.1 putative restriction endonuclease [Isoptericola jiangsuensis]
MTDWLYPVNPRTETWGYETDDGRTIAPRDLFRSAEVERELHWHLPRRYTDFTVGDHVWVRESLPVAAVVGVGVVTSSVAPDDEGALWFGVDFDSEESRRLAAEPLVVETTTRVQSMRKATPDEIAQLHARVDVDAVDDAAGRGRIRREQLVTARQGQALFRATLLTAYAGRCAVTGSDVPATLQAAHIDRYDGASTNILENGLLLRADIHNLFDSGLLWIDEDSRVVLHPDIRKSEYRKLHGQRLRLPDDPAERPSPRRLARHRVEAAGQIS